ncbi:hypothetical protein BDA99DRAFT_500662 [Phascolomyces articulosus]|uniref:Uncharacterized protein n=1 Tax=Phascolomyces articulosus TaxID=60185 RepID=A0AAD5K6F4_9FUNG|nr:hypothetical protein BDA99DRAFT_500662 [Phascolomyces articulosus]
MPYPSFKEVHHPPYTVAFAETVSAWGQDDHDDICKVLKLITSDDEFPPLQASNTTAAMNNTGENNLAHQWHVVDPRDTELNDGLTVISNHDDDDRKSDVDTSITTNWQRVDYQQSFANIASRAGENHVLILNKSFFKRERQHRQKRQPAVTVATDLENEDDSTMIDLVEDLYYIAKGNRKNSLLKAHYVKERKRNVNQYRLDHCMKTLPQALVLFVDREQEIKQQVKDVQKMKDAAENDLWPQWREWNHWRNWKRRQVQNIKGGEYFSKKVLKNKNFGRMPKAEFLRTQLLDGIIQHSVLSHFPGNKSSPLPSGKRIIGVKNQQRHIIATTTRKEEENVIDAFTRSLAKEYTRRYFYRPFYRHHFSSPWAYYDDLLLILREQLNIKYAKQLGVLDEDYKEAKSGKGMLQLLYKHFPRNYYMSDNRKLRRQHIQSIIAQYNQSPVVGDE